MNQLQPLAVDGLRPSHAAALAPMDAEDTEVEAVEALIKEGMETFPGAQTLWLYFRSRTKDRTQAWAPVRALSHLRRLCVLANAGTDESDTNGYLIFFGVHVRGPLALT